MKKKDPLSTTQKVLILFCFGVAFANIEATVVFYLRKLLPPFDETTFRAVDGLVNLMKNYDVYYIEQIREMFTLVMLLSLSALSGASLLERFAAFCLSFGTWDIFYYIFLNLIIDWPQSLFDIDVLFLVPVPWVAPVILPVFISALMIGTALHIYYVRLKKI